MNSLLSLSRLGQLSSAVVPLSLLAQPWQSPTTLTTSFSSSYINVSLHSPLYCSIPRELKGELEVNSHFLLLIVSLHKYNVAEH